MLSVVLAEGITDVEFVAGLLGIDDLEQARSRAGRIRGVRQILLRWCNTA